MFASTFDFELEKVGVLLEHVVEEFHVVWPTVLGPLLFQKACNFFPKRADDLPFGWSQDKGHPVRADLRARPSPRFRGPGLPRPPPGALARRRRAATLPATGPDDTWRPSRLGIFLRGTEASHPSCEEAGWKFVDMLAVGGGTQKNIVIRCCWGVSLPCSTKSLARTCACTRRLRASPPSLAMKGKHSHPALARRSITATASRQRDVRTNRQSSPPAGRRDWMRRRQSSRILLASIAAVGPAGWPPSHAPPSSAGRRRPSP